MKGWILALAGGLVISVMAECTRREVVAIDAGRAKGMAARDKYEAEHTASTDAWAACRRICGEYAALIPFGEHGRVTCSCIPPGLWKPDARTVPK